jgi:TRAP-type C4-dicarboxylate transport system substrate-binding protein
VDPKLVAYAKAHAGGPGAIYVGDLKQLVGLATRPDLGDANGAVTLDSLQRHSWLFDAPYYQSLLKKAKLDNPTPLTTKGKKVLIQYSCINRALQWCKLLESYFVANLLKRTEGQVEIQISSYPELGISGQDNLQLVEDGTLALTEIYGGFVAGQLPAIELQYLWGLFTDDKTFYLATNAVQDDLDRLIAEKAGGAKVILHNWATGVSQYFFTKKPFRTVADFKGAKTRSHGTALSDWIIGMGAVPQFVAFAETYSALERGILDAGVTGADPAFGQRWYEVTKYMNGPLVTFTTTSIVMNKKVWEGLPPDFQAIIIEEGAKNELEGIRVSPAWNDTGVPKLVAAGLQLIEFSPELKQRSYEVAIEKVIPNWVKRIGGPDSEMAKIFNEKIGPLVAVKINPDGSVSKVPIAK